MAEHFDVVVIGAGQAGLSVGYYLSKQEKKYVILEQTASIAPTWRGRWDSFSLVLPNWTYQLPDHGYDGDDPDGFMGRDELVTDLEQFSNSFNPEIRFVRTIGVHRIIIGNSCKRRSDLFLQHRIKNMFHHAFDQCLDVIFGNI